MSEQTQSQEHAAEPATYDVVAAQDRWRKVWDDLNPFEAADDGSRERRYALTMFPYPSGDLHMGHAEVMALHDVIARYWWQRGYDVLNPIGWDSFGLPAENAAIRRDEHPATYTYANIETQAESFRRYAMSFDWSRRLHTSDPEYYRWTQWLFLRFRERGLAYRKSSPGQLVPQRPDRAGQRAGRRRHVRALRRRGHQARADPVVLQGHRLRPAAAGRHGGAEGHLARARAGDAAQLDRPLRGRPRRLRDRARGEEPDRTVTVFTTRPDTLYGATFFVVAADAKLAGEICAPEQREAFEAYLAQVRKETDIDRLSTEREKTGVFLGRYAVNPVNGERIPVWAAGLRAGRLRHRRGDGGPRPRPARPGLREDVRPAGAPRRRHRRGEPRGDLRRHRRRRRLRELRRPGRADRQGVGDHPDRRLEGEGRGKGAVNFRLRDWLLSRQRFWGCPIPIIHCPTCGEVPVPDDQLPGRAARPARRRPEAQGHLAAGRGQDWVDVDCPSCGGPAKRDTDTMDTFVDSSWYFLRYCSPGLQRGPVRPRGGPAVDAGAQYVGGVEHAILHLLYSRFFTKVLHDMGMVDFVEPFPALLNQGQVINQGKAMSKSLGNGVNLGEQIDQYGVDAVRLTMVFAGPPEDDIDWADMSPGRVAEVPAARLAAER